MTRAQGRNEVEEQDVSSTIGGSSFKDLFVDWGDEPELVFNTVSGWIHDFDVQSEKSKVANFFQYCLSAVARTPKKTMSSGCGYSTWSRTTWL